MGFEVGTLVTLGRLQKQEFLFLNDRPARVMGLQRKGSVEQILVQLDDHQGDGFPPLPAHVLGCAYALRPANVFPAAPGRVAAVQPSSPVRLRGSPSVGRGGAGAAGEGRATPRSLAAAAASSSSSTSVPSPPRPPLVVGAWERVAWCAFFVLNVVLTLHVAAEWANAPSPAAASAAAAAAAAATHGQPGVGHGRRQRDGSSSGGGVGNVTAEALSRRVRGAQLQALALSDTLRYGFAPSLEFVKMDPFLLDSLVQRKMSTGCKWLSTIMCTPYGTVNTKHGKKCDDHIASTESGICICSTGAAFGKACGGRFKDVTFTCHNVCTIFAQERALPPVLAAAGGGGTAVTAADETSASSTADDKSAPPSGAAAATTAAAAAGGMSSGAASGGAPAAAAATSVAPATTRAELEAEYGVLQEDRFTAVATVLRASTQPRRFIRMLEVFHDRTQNDIARRRIVVFVPPGTDAAHTKERVQAQLAARESAEVLRSLVTFAEIPALQWIPRYSITDSV